MTRLSTFAFVCMLALATSSTVIADGLPREFIGISLGQTLEQVRAIFKARGYSPLVEGVTAIALCQPMDAQKVRVETIDPQFLKPRLRRIASPYLPHSGGQTPGILIFLDGRLISMRFSVEGRRFQGLLDKLKSKYSQYSRAMGKTSALFSDGQTVIFAGYISSGYTGDGILFYEPDAVENIRNLEQQHKKKKDDSSYQRGRDMIR